MEVRIKLAYLVGALVVAALAVGLLVGHYALGSHHRASSDVPSGRTIVIQTPQPDERQQNESTAQANVRAAVPGMEAFNADHSSGYAGVTLEHLRMSYDAGIRDVEIVRATSATYCVQSTVGDSTYHKAGPAGDILSGPCS